MSDVLSEIDKIQRILVLGASGSGTTTLGRALANSLATSHFDLDDIFWLPTDPPYSEPRPIPERLALIDQLFLSRHSFILSGSPLGWDITIKPRLQAVIFLYTPTEIRLSRLLRRETLRSKAMHTPDLSDHATLLNAPFNSSHKTLPDFFSAGQKELLDWASHYDDPTFPRRSLKQHEEWLKTLNCLILKLDGTNPVDQLINSVISHISKY